MFKKRRTRRKYAAQIAEAKNALAKLDAGEKHFPYPYRPERQSLETRLLHRQQASEFFESNIILKKAQRFAIEIPKASDKPDWWEDNSGEAPEYAVIYWLTETGRTGVSKLIKEERRRIADWWVKIVTPVLGALISLLGLVIALITILKR